MDMQVSNNWLCPVWNLKAWLPCISFPIKLTANNFVNYLNWPWQRTKQLFLVGTRRSIAKVQTSPWVSIPLLILTKQWEIRYPFLEVLTNILKHYACLFAWGEELSEIKGQMILRENSFFFLFLVKIRGTFCHLVFLLLIPSSFFLFLDLAFHFTPLLPSRKRDATGGIAIVKSMTHAQGGISLKNENFSINYIKYKIC